MPGPVTTIRSFARRAGLAAVGSLLAAAASAAPLLLEEGTPAEGSWYDPATPGQGLLLDALPAADLVFVAWFTYDGEGRQRWLTGQLRTNGAVASGPLFRSEGGRPNTPPGEGQRTTEVGSIALDFIDCNTMRVSYSIVAPGSSETGQFVARSGSVAVDPDASCAKRTKLKWPHAAPDLSQAGYDALADDVFIANNYAIHQGGVADRPDDTYLHSGIDLMVPQGSAIYALEDGVVRQVNSAGAGYGETVVVETGDEPKAGWAYVHIIPVAGVVKGASVTAGQLIGNVQFPNAPHLHLSRVEQPANSSSWLLNELVNKDPTAFFDLPDTEAPIIRPQLLFFRDGTDTALPEGPVSGDVDIVAGIRDPGVHARFDYGFGLLGDRANVAWIEYEIESAANNVFVHRRAWDFFHLGLTAPSGDPWSMGPVARTVVVPILRTGVGADDRVYNYYRLTHGDGGEVATPADANRSWDTDARNADGTRAFPDGVYTITVRAADWRGNIAQVQDTVEVRND